MKFFVIAFTLVSTTFLISCSNSYEVPDLKSPCVSADTGNNIQHPCGPRRRVNDHWVS